MLAGPSPEALIGPLAAATSAHPRRQRRRDAAALQPAQGGRDLQLAGGPVPGPHRPRPRSRRGHRPADHVRPAARPPRRPRPTTSRSSSPSCWPTSTARCRPTTRSRGWRRRCPAGPRRPSRGCWAPRRRARSGRPSSACPTRSRTSSTRDGAAIARDYARLRPPRRPTSPRVVVAVWALVAETDAEAERLAASSRMAITLLRRGRLIPVPPLDKALRFLAEQEGIGAAPAGARSSARRRRCARASRRSRATTARRR